MQLISADVKFNTWALALPRWILATRTRFSSFLAWSFSASQRGLALHTVVFPLPLPFPGVFLGGGPSLSKTQLRRLAQRRLTHLVCMALNFLYYGQAPPLDEVRRPPGELQQQCIRRLYNLVATCGSRLEAFPIAPGRAGPELIASLAKLETFLAVRPELNEPYARREVGHFLRSEFTEEILDKYPQLRPFRPLDATRLKLNGTGSWPLEEYLEGPLWLPYVEPDILFHGLSTKGCPVPLLRGEVKESYWELAERWESLGLLMLCKEPAREGAYVRVFNAYKSEAQDRQIGDRRKVNCMERHLGGPSSQLPQGQQLVHLFVPKGCDVRGSVTDRRDFYTQCAITWERASTHLTPFAFPLEDFKGMKAYDSFIEREAEMGKKHREVAGDKLGFGGSSSSCQLPSHVYPAFGALYQGDHLGVECALGGHLGLLQSENLLKEENRLLGKMPPPMSKVWEALVIDDYFVISVQDGRTGKEETEAFKYLNRARDAYKRHALAGSEEKDVISSSLFKAAGAEVDATEETRRRGYVCVGSPLAKRIGLSTLSLRVAALGQITPSLAARLSGGWVSALLYRRCLSSVVDDLFQLGNFSDASEATRLKPLSRKASEELSLLAVLAPCMSTNAMAEVSHEVFATDASMAKGAIVSTLVDEEVAKVLWNGSDKKGAYTMLDGHHKSLLRHLGEETYEASEDEEICFEGTGIPRERPFFFDFIEICGGVGAISDAMSSLGFVVAPVFDLSRSRQYNLKSIRVLEWFLFMISEGRIAAYALAPPCTTFSPAAHPCVRSYTQPAGFDRLHPKVLHGNGLAFPSLIIMWQAYVHRRPSLLEQPRLSKMAWLTAWRWLMKMGLEEAVVAACRFGSPHRKEFRLLVCGLEADQLEARCLGGHSHIQIAGRFTKASAIYPEKMALHLAESFAVAIRRKRLEEFDGSQKEGKESLLVNDLLLSQQWRVKRSWHWKRRSHINVLETGAVTSLIQELVAQEPDARHNVLVDSAVAQGALAKGRSSANSLKTSLRRASALQVAGGLQVGISFAPTRLNQADHPTRDRSIPSPSSFSLITMLEDFDLQAIHHQKLSRSSANWVRLSLLVCLTAILPAGALEPLPCSSYRSRIFILDFSVAFEFAIWLDDFINFFLISVSSSSSNISLWISSDELFLHLFPIWIWFLDFFASLSRCSCPFLATCISIWWTILDFIYFALILIFFSLITRSLLGGKWLPRVFSWFVVFHAMSLLPGVGAPLAPLTVADDARAAARAGIRLASDRVIKQETRSNRYQLLDLFQEWLHQEHGIDLGFLLQQKPVDAETIANLLAMYGRDMHRAGRSYGKYAETINALAMTKPIIKRQLTSAWDVAFAWLQDEPQDHHPAMPASVLLAVVSLSLIWGWATEAAIFSLCWAGILRVGEVVGARRSDLVLPADGPPGCKSIWLRIREPKTRGRGARHQAAKVDAEDLVALISGVFGKFEFDQLLWGFSAQTLRKRLLKVLSAIGLPISKTSSFRPYELSSLRPGGATFLLNLTESPDLVRRRGRWASIKVMEIYLQEVAVATGVNRLDYEVREKIRRLSDAFPEILRQALCYLRCAIPCKAWYVLFQHHQGEEVGGKCN